MSERRPRTRRLAPADVRRVPWKNGRGTTDELAIGPDGASFDAGDFDWRIARAGVAEPAPFSRFDGFDRVLVVIEGAGLRLTHEGRPPLVVEPLAPHRFAGEDAPHADLVAGPVRDLNVLTRRGRATARVRVVRPGLDPVRLELGRGIALLHVVQGDVSASDELDATSASLHAGESLLTHAEGAPGAWSLSSPGAATAIVVEIAFPPAP